MNRIQANITTPLDKIAGDVNSLLQAEYAVVNGWKDQGILEHLYLKDGRSGAILVFKDVDQARVEALLTTLPLHPYIEQVELMLLEKSF